jgi:hypothetical protein
MSYDLRLFEVPDGVEPQSAYDNLVQREETELVNADDSIKRSLPASTRERMQELADALSTQWPAFVQFEPKTPLPWIELNDAGVEVQVSVHEGSVSITMPYFRERATEMMECVRCCIQVCYRERGYVAFDPQLGRVVAVDDSASSMRAYRRMDKALPEIRGELRPVGAGGSSGRVKGCRIAAVPLSLFRC